MSHADIRTTQRYLHASEKSLIAATNSVSDKISEVMNMKPKEVLPEKVAA